MLEFLLILGLFVGWVNGTYILNTSTTRIKSKNLLNYLFDNEYN